MAKPARSKHRASAKAGRSPWRNILLTLTLVPLVIGILLIGAWALDILVLEDFQSQITIGILFFLVSFAASNALQQRWGLALGWGLLMCADIILLLWLDVRAQIPAALVGAAGLCVLLFQFYRQYAVQRRSGRN